MTRRMTPLREPSLKTIPRILITPGEPAGIGPDITVQIAKASWPAEIVVVCDPELLIQRGTTTPSTVGLLMSLIQKNLSNYINQAL